MVQCEEWIVDIQQYSSDKWVGRIMFYYVVVFKCYIVQFCEELLKFFCFEGLDFDIDDVLEVCRIIIGVEEILMYDQVKFSSSKEFFSDFQL